MKAASPDIPAFSAAERKGAEDFPVLLTLLRPRQCRDIAADRLDRKTSAEIRRKRDYADLDSRVAMSGRPGSNLAGLLDDRFLDIAELILAEEHFLPDEESG